MSQSGRFYQGLKLTRNKPPSRFVRQAWERQEAERKREEELKKREAA